MCELQINLAFEEVAAVFVHQVPLVVGDDESLASVGDQTEDFLVLLTDGFGGINEKHTYLSGLNGTSGA